MAFFAEAFGLYYTGELEDGYTNPHTLNNRFNTTALGIGLGQKFVTYSQSFSLEFNVGIGRNINPLEFQNTFMYKAGLSIGFRF